MSENFQNEIVAAGNIIKEPNGFRFLLVQEGRKEPEIYGKWNFPMGRLEKGESLIQCAAREAKEETGYEVKPLCLVGEYQKQFAGHALTVYIFNSIIVGGELKIPEDGDILDAKWLTFEEIQDLHRIGLLFDDYVAQAIDDFMEGKRIKMPS